MDPVRYAEDTPPDLEGPHGRAWKSDIEAIARRYPEGPPPSLTVAAWIVEAKWAHPLWHSYAIACISLRSVEGWPNPKIYLEGATHEVMLYALNPDSRRALNDVPEPLNPANFHGQWIAKSDEGARDYIDETVRLIVDGRLNPDTDAMRDWIRRFSNSNMKVPDELAGTTLIGVSGDKVTVVGTGKTAMDAILQMAAGPTPPKEEQN